MGKTLKGLKRGDLQNLNFERERLINLIDSKIRRKEMVHAREFAEELFRTELEFALLRKTERLKTFNSFITQIIVCLVSILLGSIVCMVLNINPSFYLAVQALTLLGIVLAIAFNALFVKRFEKALRVMMDTCENLKQSFIEGVLDSLISRGGAAVSFEGLGINGAK